jgi:putative oxidoreductase
MEAKVGATEISTAARAARTLAPSMARFLAALAPFVARLLAAALFLWSGWSKVSFPPGAAARIAAQGLPWPKALAIAAGVTELALGLLLVLGFRARAAAGALVVFVAFVTWRFHLGAALGGDGAQAVQVLKNGAVVSALLLLVAHGPGSLSVDRG